MGKVVWFIFQEASPIGKGAYSRHYYFAKELQKKGYKTKVITSTFHHFQNKEKRINKMFEDSVEDGVPTLWIKVNKYKGAHSYKRIIAWLAFMSKLFLLPLKRLQPPNYIIASSPSLHAVVGANFLNKFYKKSKLILEIRDIWPKTLVEVGGISKNNLLIRWMFQIEKRAYKNASFIISTLPYANKRVEEVLGHNSFNFKCIPQGISPVNISSEVDFKIEDKLSLPKDKFIIGYSGTVGASNALETFILTAKSFFIDEDNRFYFLVIGEGSSLPDLKKMAKNLTNIKFIPKVPKIELPKILNRCNLLYDSTKIAEIYKYGLSRNKWIDYMLASKPMIVSYSGEVTMINEAKNGIVVNSENVNELKNGILSLSKKNKQQLEEMGSKGHNFILENRTFTKLTEELENVLLNVSIK